MPHRPRRGPRRIDLRRGRLAARVLPRDPGGIADQGRRGHGDRTRLVPVGGAIGPSLVVREPAGVVGAITPWNYPLHQVVAKVAPALAAGCTVVVKPSQVAPLSAFVLADVLVEAGVPPGVCNIVTGHGRGPGRGDRRPPRGRRRVAHRVAGRRPPGDGARRADRQARHARARRQVGDRRPRRRRRRRGHPGMCRPVLPQRRPELLCAVPSDRAAGVARRVEEIAATAAEAFVVGDPFDPATRDGSARLGGATRRASATYIRIGIDEGARLLSGGAEPPDGLDRGYFVRPTRVLRRRPGDAHRPGGDLRSGAVHPPARRRRRRRPGRQQLSVRPGRRSVVGGPEPVPSKWRVACARAGWW